MLATALVWRHAVRRFVLPCPTRFAWALENPVMERVAGSAALLDRAEVRRGMRVLDAGCGPGRLTIPAARQVGEAGEVIGVDSQAGMLRMLEERLQQHHVTNVRLRHGELGGGTIEPGHYDRVLLVTVLGEIRDRRAALVELATALKPGGLLSITEVRLDPHYQRPRVVRRLAAEAGLEPAGFFGGLLAYTANFAKPEPAA
jgi:ubiquinone/menaquinone biosynthesis C-methylase UbiE